VAEALTPPPAEPAPADERLGRERRLRYARHLRLLFERGQRLRIGPLQLVYLHPGPADLPVSQRADAPVPTFPILAAFSAPKRYHRRSVRRHRVRRLMREVYRRQALPRLRGSLDPDQPLWLYWIWQDRRLPTLAQLSGLMAQAAERLSRPATPRPAPTEPA